MPSASVRAKPRRSVPRWPSAADGLRKRAAEKLSEQMAETDACARHAKAGETGADIFRSNGIHEVSSFEVWKTVSDQGEGRR